MKETAGKPRPAKRLTVADVARHAGVSTGTVSRVVNEVPGVGAQVAEKVHAAIRELGWSPSIAAQNMRSHVTHTIGFVFSDIRNTLYASMTRGAEEVLSPRGYLLISSSSDGLADREIALIDLFKRRRADGLILTVADEQNAAVRRAILQSQTPFVMLERALGAQSTSIGADHFGGTMKAMAYLLGLGHRRIALITGGRNTLVMRDRLRAYRLSMEEAGLPVDETLLKLDSFESEYGYQQAQSLMLRPDAPTAILCLGVRLLPGVVSALQTLGKSFPEDVSLVCSNDADLARFVTPPITAIRYDALELGRLAARCLLEKIENPAQAQHPHRLEAPTELILRRSCRAVAA